METMMKKPISLTLFRLGRLILFVSWLCLAYQAQANLAGMATHYGHSIDLAKTMMATQGLFGPVTTQACEAQVPEMTKDGQINVTVAFGYMDVSTPDQSGDPVDLRLPRGTTLDRDAHAALELALLSACSTFSVKSSMVRNTACGFTKSRGYLTKTIKDRFSGRRIAINLRLVAPSETSYDSLNTKSPSQISRSRATTDAFHNGLQSDDVVIYMGHARSGGGPDFYPPVLDSKGRVDYGHYKSRREGINGMLRSLSSTRTPPKIIGVLACKSTPLFARQIKTEAPHSILVTAGELFDYNDILPTGYAMIEAIASQSCSQRFQDLLRIQPASRSFLQISR
jgi:hypothetical protein